MTSNSLRNSLLAVLAFTVAAMLIVASAFAADGDNGNSKRRGNNGKLNTATFQIVVPKADRGGSGRQVAKFVAPKANRTGSTTAQFVAPKADRGNSSGPTTLFSVSPKAPRAGNGPAAGNGPITAKFVAPKALRGDGPVLVKVEEPSLQPRSSWRPRLMQLPSTSSMPLLLRRPAETKAPVVVASQSPAAVPAASEASAHEVELAYIRAAQHYGYGDDEGADQGYDEGSDEGYAGGSYGDDGCY